jgi:tetratricopeptide (TPR) repeat protein
MKLRPGRVLRHANLVIVLGLAGLVGLVFGSTVRYDFVGLDDRDYVVENPHVLGGLTAENLAWAFTTTEQSNWHPVTWLSLMLDAELGGGPGGYHLTNVVLHLANTLLLFLVLDRATSARWRSALVAALFAVHPLHVESVAWIAERKDVLSTSFMFLTLAAYERYCDRPGPTRYAFVFLSMALGLLAKPMLVTLPAVLVLLDFWPLGRLSRGVESWRTALRPPWGALFDKLPLVALSLASCAVTLFAQARGGAVGSLSVYPLGLRAGNAALSYVRYILRMFWPVDLAVPYPYDIETITPWRVAAAAAILTVLTWLSIRAARRRPYLVVGWLWYVITLLPVIGLIQVGAQSMADRYTYVPLIGLFVALVWSVTDLLATAPSPVRLSVTAAAAGLVAVLAVAAHTQVRYWRDTISLFTHVLAVTEDNATAHNALGLALHRENRADASIAHFRDAVAIWPNYTAARTNLAGALMRSGKPEEGIAQYREALRYAPGDAAILMDLGVALMVGGRLDESAEVLREALSASPGSALGHAALGAVLGRLGEHEAAVGSLREAIRLDPGAVEPRVNLGIALMKLGSWDEAAAELDAASRIAPRSAAAHRNLGAALAHQGDLARAAAHFEEALFLEPRDPGTRANLERVRRRLAGKVD